VIEQKYRYIHIYMYANIYVDLFTDLSLNLLQVCSYLSTDLSGENVGNYEETVCL